MKPLSEFLKGIFGWLDSPWKAVVVMLFMVMGSVIYGFYSQADLIERVLERRLEMARLDDVALTRALPQLLRVSDLAAGYHVNIQTNYQEAIAAFTADGEVAGFAGGTYPYLSSVADPEEAAAIAVKEVILGWACFELKNGYAGMDGYTYACAQRIPGDRPGFVGLIHAAWKVQPGHGRIERARALMSRIAYEVAQ